MKIFGQKVCEEGNETSFFSNKTKALQGSLVDLCQKIGGLDIMIGGPIL